MVEVDSFDYSAVLLPASSSATISSVVRCNAIVFLARDESERASERASERTTGFQLELLVVAVGQ
jgi:hypothetical protein